MPAGSVAAARPSFKVSQDASNAHVVVYRAGSGGANWTMNTLKSGARTFAADVGTPNHSDKMSDGFNHAGGEFGASGSTVVTSATDMSSIAATTLKRGADDSNYLSGRIAQRALWATRISVAEAQRLTT